MSANQPSDFPSMPPAKRRSWPRRVLVAVVLLAALYTAAWFTAAYIAGNRIDEALAKMDTPERQVRCADRRMIGFPLRFGVSCEQSAVGRAGAGSVAAGRFEAAMPLLSPGTVETSLASPATLDTGRGTTTLEWTAMDAVATGLRGPGYESLRLDARDLTITAGPHGAAVKSAVLTSSPFGETDLAIAATFDDVVANLPYERSLNGAKLTLAGRLTDGYTDLVLSRLPLAEALADGARIGIDTLLLEVPDGGAFAAKGDLTLDAAGLLTGKATFGLDGARALQAFLATIAPEAVQPVNMLGQALSGMGRATTFGTREMPGVELTVDEGRLSLGFIQIGEIPPLRLR